MQSLRALKLSNCISLEALPAGLGQLTGLKTLRLDGCVKLTNLPMELGLCTGLTTLNIEKCRALLLPEELKKDNSKAEDIVGFLAATFVVQREPEGWPLPVQAWLHKRPAAVSAFLEAIVTDPANAQALEKAVAACPSITEVSNRAGQKAFELACKECRDAMQGAKYLLGRYEVDNSPPLYLSRTSAVLAARDRQDGDGTTLGARRALKLMRDEATLLSELKGRQGIENGVLLPILTVYACTGAPQNEHGEEPSFEYLYDGKVPIARQERLEEKLTDLMLTRCAIGGAVVSAACEGYKYLLVQRLAEGTLANLAPLMSADLPCLRKAVSDIAKGLDKLHTQKKVIHADLHPRHVVLAGNAWQLVDMGLSVRLERGFGKHKTPTSSHCPPEMARVLVSAIDQSSGQMRLGELKAYGKANVAYDLWSLGCILFQLVFGATVWRAMADGQLADPTDLERLASWTDVDLDELLHSAMTHDGAGSRIERLAAADLIRKLLHPSEAARLKPFDTFAGNEMRAVLRHPFLTGDTAGTEVVAAEAEAAATRASKARAEKQRKAKDDEAAAHADYVARNQRLQSLEEEVREKSSQLVLMHNKLKEADARNFEVKTALDSAQTRLNATRSPLERLEQLDERDTLLRAERERVQGALRENIEAHAKDAEGMFGHGAKEKIALLQSILDAFASNLPEVKDAAVAPIPQLEPARTSLSVPSSTNSAKTNKVPPLAASGSEERHLNELMEKLEAKDVKLHAIESQSKQQQVQLTEREALVADLEAQVAALRTKAAAADRTEDSGSTKIEKKPKGRKSGKLPTALPISEEQTESNTSQGGQASARTKKPGKLTMAQRMAAFQ